MSYPIVNLNAANAIFNAIGIIITKHDLGYYEAIGRGYTFQETKLIDLTHKVLKQLTEE